ncbi:phosphoribosylaminoimidazolesuccinocarboxamide synthase [Candidatus Aminicenantes bacterium AC-335-A11]|jgi:phosphoribosylaminoimidazole-succinocarboxamide synthase|nr:phosphoribosylaminoimidazolesuccinocarboxamide synthase [SCandidatus Aminicenantes bacterium Aminicenantia_JdfR_composite]MCP2598421.1 phosphoribosylaminoimidazolesuccinocarboxamide synthase [Candidatus Aminicenantes bacterium AC-335-L06]MCP2618439.1 phosphoribosylaminoimidazolesuccinocarboxamide synthase [Candidatus Aminicenantes bacterium AC-335-A11]
MEKTLDKTEIKEIPLFKRGKVRDIYDLGDKLLIIATDRISAFDFVLPSTIPYKGKVLTQLSKFWFNYLSPFCKNHLISTEVKDFPSELHSYREMLEKRSMLVRKTRVIPIECVVRGYLAGSGWKEYKSTGKVCNIPLPEGLREADKLDTPIFTPAIKSEEGHDINISFDEMKKIVNPELAEKMRNLSLLIYTKAASYAISKGIIIADTKFEFGLLNNDLILIDEVLTPDSSRFWPEKDYEPGRSQPSFDKQFVRDYLESTDWDKKSPPPPLPDEVIEKTSQKYLEAYYRITGKRLT